MTDTTKIQRINLNFRKAVFKLIFIILIINNDQIVHVVILVVFLAQCLVRSGQVRSGQVSA